MKENVIEHCYLEINLACSGVLLEVVASLHHEEADKSNHRCKHQLMQERFEVDLQELSQNTVR